MYTENLPKDALLFAKAVFSNQVARFLPSLYVKLTHQTGRGHQEEDAAQIADYYSRCFIDYIDRLNSEQKTNIDRYLRGKKVLEYGPGDILGVALLMYTHGVECVDCVDRFPLNKISEKNLEVYRILLESLKGKERVRAESAFKDRGLPESGFNPSAINYSVRPDGLTGETKKYDLIISRAVLEHVNNLESTILDISNALKTGGVAIHEVDLKSHGLDRYQAFDFLTWPEMLYKLMYGYKGFPNRWRVNRYKELVEKSGLRFVKLIPTGTLEVEKLDLIRPKMARLFRPVPSEELSWLGFWMVLEHERL